MKATFVHLLIGLMVFKNCATAVSQSQSTPTQAAQQGAAAAGEKAAERKTFLNPMMPMLPYFHNFQAANPGAPNQLPGSDQTAGAPGTMNGMQTPSFYDQLAMMSHPMNPVSPLNPMNNPMINPIHPLNPGNSIQHHIFKRDGSIETVHDEGLPGFGMNGMPGMGGMGWGGYQGEDVTDPSDAPVAIPKITVRSKCDSVKRQAVSIANAVMKTQNTIVYRELINYLIKSKFLLGMTEIKLARLLRKRMYSVMKQFSSLTSNNLVFVDAKFDDGTTVGDSLNDPDILDSGDYPSVDHVVGDIQPNMRKKKKL